MNTTYRRAGAEERGGVLVEMAITLPLLLMLLVFGVDFGRAINEYLSLSQVAYEASRYAARDSKLNGLISQNERIRIDNEGDFAQRIDRILERYHRPDGTDDGANESFKPDNISVSAFFNTTTKEIEIEMTKMVQLVFPFGQLNQQYGTELPITVRVTGPYLFPGDN